ncbi:MAG: UDP-N-acetylglucosamine 2-epimerase (non-hydrolyzing) [Flavobacteriaceae bacterium]|nr:UDP-N-acetylglucosamine 2-epimerase (non-hydrolyzing) [Flavobacteriaceae bacterium]|tara:strand:+ start:3247 stop:4329 length:1083 start_codon:yes stop_codon:yes gene_type:complete
MKLVTIIGARPQFIKAAAVSNSIKNHNTEAKNNIIQEVIVHTGQHFDLNMSNVFFDEMKIPKPDYLLNINSLSHGAMTGRMLEEIETVLKKEKPDWVLVYGDTNSTLAGALAASKLHIKVAHVEAGLRSFNMKMPEEINRILTDRISSLLFCPTETAVNNLEKEGYNKWNNRIVKSGDVMLDAALFFAEHSKKPQFKIPENFILCTIHRAENTDDLSRLTSIIAALNIIAEEQTIILPLHPRTKKILINNSISISSNITLIPPVGYLEMVYLLNNCSLVMTDSGGLQKEAFFFSKFCLTMRDETEWVELVENEANHLVGANKDLIISTYRRTKDFKGNFDKPLYGKGDASNRIIEVLSEL